jgi:hypothetical protein
MLRAAGFAEVATNTWSDRMIDAVVLWGNEAQVEERLWIGSLKHFSRRAAGPAAPRVLAGRPARRGVPRRSGLQPGRARWSATLAGAGQAPQQAGGEGPPLMRQPSRRRSRGGAPLGAPEGTAAGRAAGKGGGAKPETRC